MNLCECDFVVRCRDFNENIHFFHKCVYIIFTNKNRLTYGCLFSILLVSGCATLLARRIARGVHAWAPLYILLAGGKGLSQTFFTYEQQLNRLMSEKMLSIEDDLDEKIVLEQISYYSLIGGYKEPFKHNASGNYKHGVVFEEIVALYFFDEELRTLFLKYILHVERHMKSIISYHFCEKYGEYQQEYLNPHNYTLTKKNIKEVNRLVHSIQKAISLPSRYTYIAHHAKKYGNVPLWVAMNALTFGQVSKIYQYVPNDIQYKISKNAPYFHILQPYPHYSF